MAHPHMIPDAILDNALVYRAGEIVPPGTYWELDGLREVRLSDTGVLPASLNGRVAFYILKPAMWRQEQLPRGGERDRRAA